MIYNLNEDNMNRFVEILNEEDVGEGHHLLVYATRGAETSLKVHFCSWHEWRAYFRSSYESEYMKQNIDVAIDIEIGAKIRQEMEKYL